MAAEAIGSGIYDLRLENDVLKFSEDQVLYRDQPIQGGLSLIHIYIPGGDGSYRYLDL